MIGRDVFRKHPESFTEDEWRQAQEFVALALLEQREMEEAQRHGGE